MLLVIKLLFYNHNYNFQKLTPQPENTEKRILLMNC